MRIAIVNDLALAREVLRRLVTSVAGYSVAWLAADGEEAVRMVAADPPDVVLMDLVMPGVNGVEATRRIMQTMPCPILIVTASVSSNYEMATQALGAGGLDAVTTPILGPGGSVVNGEPLLARLARLQQARVGIRAPRAVASRQQSADLPAVVAVGASTGGPDALAEILRALPASFHAAVLIVQHISVEFARGMAEQLSRNCRLPVRLAQPDDIPSVGVVLLAASDDHLILGPDRRLAYTADPPNYPYRPSADVLFNSLAAWGPRDGVGVLLTGMGPDGADGLAHLREAGWHTIAQDEATSVVFGMPRAAVERGAAAEVLPLPLIGQAIVSRIRMVTRT